MSTDGCLPRNCRIRCRDGDEIESTNNYASETPGKNTHHDKEKFDIRISNALNGMSLKERDMLYQQIHGVEEIVNETPEFVAERLNGMQNEIDRLTKSSLTGLPTQAYLLAKSQNASFVSSKKILLKFLRVDRFDVRKAARRLIRYFDWKMVLFGKEKLCKDITYADLHKEDIKDLKKGFVQRLPERDQAGRAVYFILGCDHVYPSAESFGRILYYVGMTDEETDRRGSVIVVMNCGHYNFKNFRPGQFMMTARANEDGPMAGAIVHSCIGHENIALKACIDFFTDVSKEDERLVRMKIHCGSYYEWMYELMTYGIPHHLLPLTAEEKVKTKNHLEFLQMRRVGERMAAERKEQEGEGGGQTNVVETIELPLASDVLLGKGRPIQNHAGNMHLQAVVDEHLDQYHSIQGRLEKTALAALIVRKVKEASGRFLSKESGIWIEVSDELARNKVSYLFRNRRVARDGK